MKFQQQSQPANLALRSPTTIDADRAAALGRDADSPWRMPWRAWPIVLKRAWSETSEDNVGLIAAGVAFYGFLALVPLLGATVLVYGLVADPPTVIAHVGRLAEVLPAAAAGLIGDQLLNVVAASDGKKGAGLVLAVAIALFGARNAAGAIITALNVAYEERETRSFVRVNLLSLGITAAAVTAALGAMAAISALAFLGALLPAAPDWLLAIGKVGAYGALAGAGAAGAATLYRFGPSRADAKWVWLTPGSLFAAFLWLAVTLGFGVYVANFGDYDATYGSLGAVVVLLTWMYLSSYILLLGAELNAELEHQTAKDTTKRDAPIGARGAWVADHVADTPLDAAAGDVASEGIASERPAEPGFALDYAVSRAAARAALVLRQGSVARWNSAVAVVGLGQLRKRGRAPVGASLLALAAVAAWLGREREASASRDAD